MRPDHLPLLTSVSAPVVHPSGTWACVATSRPDLRADAYVGQLWRLDLSGDAAPRRITRGFADSRPHFSPDGRLLAFLRSAPGEKPQVYLVRADGGEPMRVTDARLGVSEVVFSPDSTRLVYVARVADAGRYGDLDGVSPAQEDPRHLTTLQFRANGLGWTHDRPRQLFVVDVPDPDAEPIVAAVGRAAQGAPTPHPLVPPARALTWGPYDHTQPVVVPDGAAVLTVASRRPDRDRRLAQGIYRVPLDGGEPTVLLEPDELDLGHPRFSPDGGTLFLLGSDLGPTGRDVVARNTALYAAAPDGTGLTRLTDPETTDVLGAALEPTGPDAALVLDRARGLARLVRAGRDGVRELLSGLLLTGAAAVPGGDDVVVSFVGTDTAGDVGVVSGGALRRLTDFSAPLRDETTLAHPTELTASAPDGYPVHGWVWRPEGEGPHPVLLNIHGGPFADYHPTFFDEFQTYVAAGYAVVACNPRGAAGYGQAHGAAIRDDFGNLDAADVLAFLDHAVETLPGLDGSRVGVMGGSYGGYLTAWLIAHDHRWAGAIVERGYLDPASFVGASDIGWFFAHAYNGTAWEDLNRQSPLLRTHQVRTPTLVLHSEDDLRCPLDQALRYYAELRLGGVDAELLVFPGENHELSRSGTPHHRKQRLEHVLDWWSRWLPVAP